MVTQFQRTQYPFVPGGLALWVCPHTSGAAQINMLRTVQIIGCLLTRNLQQYIKILAKALYRRHVQRSFCEMPLCFSQRSQGIRHIRIGNQLSGVYGHIVLHTVLRATLHPVQTQMHNVTVFFPRNIEQFQFVFDSPVIVPICQIQRTVRCIPQRRTTVNAVGVCNAFRTYFRKVIAQFIIRTAETDAQLGSAVTHRRFIRNIIVVLMIVGEQRAQVQPVADTGQVAHLPLQPVTVTPRILAPVVFTVQDDRRFLFVCHPDGQIAGSQFLART